MSTHLEATEAVASVLQLPQSACHRSQRNEPKPAEAASCPEPGKDRPVVYNETNPSPTLLKAECRPKIAHDETNPTKSKSAPAAGSQTGVPTQDPSESFWYPERGKALAL